MCESRGVAYDEDDLQTTLKTIYSFCKSTLLLSTSDGSASSTSSPYEIISTEITRKCLFLLQLNCKPGGLSINGSFAADGASDTSMNTDGLEDLPDLRGIGVTRGDSTYSDLDIKPIGVNRSISQPINEKLVDKEKLRAFRAWVDSYQKWK